MSRQLTADDYDAIAAQMATEMADMLGAETETEPFDPGKKKAKPVAAPNWEPLHGPTQKLAMRDQNKIVGLCAEKFTGKSIVCLDKVIAHCHLEWDALFVIIGNSHRALSEGVCADLVNFSLPRWRDGNREPLFDPVTMLPNPRAGELIDSGIGLEFTGWKMDANNKDLYLKIRNRHGGWSRIRVIAIPYAKMVQSRVTNLNASGFYLEEATNCDGDEYYTFPSLQLFRRRGIKGAQQFLFTCNPSDPKNWVCKWMYEDVVVTKSEPGRDFPNDPHKPGVRRDPSVSFYYLHYEENKHNVSQENRDQMKRTLRGKPTLRARLFDSKWVAMPSGEALFKDEFSESKHIKGDADKHKGLTPVPDYPIVIGFDTGARSVGMSFKQIIDSDSGPFDLTFDEIAYHMEMITTRRLAIALLEILRYWNEWLRRVKEWDPAKARTAIVGNELVVEPPPSFCVWVIAGDDAVTNWRPETGSVNARHLEVEVRKLLEEEPARYIGIVPFRVKGCPRPPGSVDKRVDLTAEDLMTDMVAISATCPAHKDMFFQLESDPNNPGQPKKRNKHIHVFDGFSYPKYYRKFVLGEEGFYNFSEGAAMSIA